MKALLVLGHYMAADGKVDQETASRLESAVRLHEEIDFQLILLSGWAYRQDSDISLADGMYSYMKTNHPSVAGLCYRQGLSRDTVGDAFFSRLFIEEVEAQFGRVEVSVLTSTYHTQRCKEIFGLLYPSVSHVYGEDFKVSEIVEKHEVESAQKFFETFKDLKSSAIRSVYNVLRNKHPYYNGQIFPKLESMDRLREKLIQGK